MANGKPIKAFEADLKGFAEQLNIEFGKVVRKVVFDLHKTVTDISPVDTGRFRASWGISQFEIPDEPGEPPSETGEPDSVPATNQRKRVRVDSRDVYSIWYIYNNLPYAQPLEDGHSGQAPNGILDLALATVEAEVEQAVEDFMFRE